MAAGAEVVCTDIDGEAAERTAAALAAGVLVVCKSAVETPIPKGRGRRIRRPRLLPQGQGVKTAYDPDRLARDSLRAIEKNKALLVKPRLAHAQWLFARLAPGLMQRASIRFIERQREVQAAARSAAG